MHICGYGRADLLADATQPLVTLAPPLGSPPDFMLALQQLIDGSAVMYEQAQKLPLPLLVQRGAAAVPRCRDLLTMYRILSQSLEELAELVRSGYSTTHTHACAFQ